MAIPTGSGLAALQNQGMLGAIGQAQLQDLYNIQQREQLRAMQMYANPPMIDLLKVCKPVTPRLNRKLLLL